MTETHQSPSVTFMVGLRKIDNSGLKVRDAIVLWGIAREPGMMGRELATKLGYASRSNVQDSVRRLIDHKLIEDRRTARNQQTPNDLYITPAGQQFLDDIVPA